MAIIKKNKDEKLYSKENYIISAPIVLSTEKKEYDKTYLYTFTEPFINFEGAIIDDFDNVDIEVITNKNGQNAETSDYTNKQSTKKELNGKVTYNNSGVDEHDQTHENITIDMDMANEYEKQIYLPAKENIKFTFSKPDYVRDDVNKSNDSLIETKIKKVTQCKVCWIFKNLTCEDCVTRSNDEHELKLDSRSEPCQDKNLDKSTEQKACKFCWIFNNKNCDICKGSGKAESSFSKIAPTGSESEVTEKEIMFKKLNDYEINLFTTGKVTPNNNIVEKDNKSMKRKISEDSTSEYKKSAKKAKWECNICLTVNKNNRETCICCEHYYVLDTETSVSKFNWGHSEIFASNFGQKLVKNDTFTDDINLNIASEESGLEKQM